MNSFIQGRITGTEKRAPVLVDSTGRLLMVLSSAVEPGSAALVPTSTAYVASGTVPAGCRQITFIASSDFVGTILTNLPFTAGASLTITAPAGVSIGAIAFTRTAGTLYSIEIR